LKAFGVTNISVPGPDTREYLHPFVNPFKFDGLLPVLWREDGDTVYGVPMPSRSLAHVIPAKAIVGREPLNGLDTEPAIAYVSALDDPAMPQAQIQWKGPSRAVIRARMTRAQLISVQVTYNPAWHADSAGRPLTVRKDGLGLIVIDPVCSGDCEIDLHYDATPETWFCRLMSALVSAVLAAMLIVSRDAAPLVAGFWREILEHVRHGFAKLILVLLRLAGKRFAGVSPPNELFGLRIEDVDHQGTDGSVFDGGGCQTRPSAEPAAAPAPASTETVVPGFNRLFIVS
jgi:hypothetical protein